MQGWGIFTRKLERSSTFSVHVQGLFSPSLFYLKLFYIVPASVTVENDTIVVLEGRNATLYCLPAGVPSPNFSWIDFSNQNLEGSILKFLNISRHGNGSCTCSATNFCGSDRKKVDIVVECEPI